MATTNFDSLVKFMFDFWVWTCVSHYIVPICIHVYLYNMVEEEKEMLGVMKEWLSPLQVSSRQTYSPFFFGGQTI